ncbi:hypothetical protein BDN67DRAFT_967807 [Paxillus ammoniavirescens]|nr:hypothetical protein BDN67DRAFT_967807 [Paxillus ammoniavirescens]
MEITQIRTWGVREETGRSTSTLRKQPMSNDIISLIKCASLLHEIERFRRVPLFNDTNSVMKDPLRLWNEQVEYAVQLVMLFSGGLGGPCSRASGARLEMAGYHR